MRKWIVMLTLLTVMVIGTVPVAAQTGTIPEVASANSSFSTLVAAVQAAGLIDDLSARGPFTVFAPTNGAFGTLLNELGVTANDLFADTDLLTEVLLYHVVAGEVRAADILGASLPLTVTTLGGAELVVNVAGGRVSLNNGRATVEIADIDASNGVIHVIDNVLLPPTTTAGDAPAVASTGTIVDVLAGNPNFSTLVAAVTAAGLADELSARGSFTVFAPTNGAFATLLGNLGVTADQLLADRALLTSVLLYHVLPGEYRAADILAANLPLTLETLNGADVVINFNGQRVTINGSTASVEIPNVVASNGVIHIIDNVLLPQ